MGACAREPLPAGPDAPAAAAAPAALDARASHDEHAALSAGSSSLAITAQESRGRSASWRPVAPRPAFLHAAAGARTPPRGARLAHDLTHRHDQYFRRAAADGDHTSTPPPHIQG